MSAIVVNGDMIDGEQGAQRGTELCLPILKDQGEAAAICLETMRDIVGNVPFYGVQGTEFHDSKGGQAADAVAERLNMVAYKGYGTGKRSREILDLDVDGAIINFLHGISVSSGLYRATAPDREALWSALSGKEGKAERADCIVRSHAHYFVHLEHPTKHAVITPCFELQTRYMRKNSAYRMMPDIGAVVIWVDGEVKKLKGDPIRVVKRLFPLPVMRAVKLQVPVELPQP